MVRTKKGWTRGDSLGVASTCLAVFMGVAFQWMERTPGWALFTVTAMALLAFFPIYHFLLDTDCGAPIINNAKTVVGMIRTTDSGDAVAVPSTYINQLIKRAEQSPAPQAQ